LVVECCKGGFFGQAPELECCLLGHFVLLFLNCGCLFGSDDDSNMIICVFFKCGWFLAEGLNLFRVLTLFFLWVPIYCNVFGELFFRSWLFFFGPSSVSGADWDNQNMNSSAYHWSYQCIQRFLYT